ncbi:MAG: tetratricopeptide repeat protein [Acidobacteriota bacterium]|nr:tetratricopeptide repeat protein [Acidobacteriota bacterium]
MSDKRTSRVLVATLTLLLVFAVFGCQKLSVKKLTANYHFNKANSLFIDNKFTKAIAEYKATLENNPELTDAYRFLGESYKALYVPGKETADNKERADLALQALQKAFDSNNNNKDIIYSLGDMYDKLQDFDNAEKMYLRIIDLEPGNMNNYYIIAEFYKRYAPEKKELKEKAEQMYLRRIETDPENVQGYAYMANYFDQLSPTEFKDKFDNALVYHMMRKQLEPASAEIYYTIGVNRFNKAYQLQNYLSDADKRIAAAEAEQNLLKAIEIDANFPDAYAYMKILYINVQAKLYPEKEGRYQEEANRFGDKFTEARTRQLERMKLEKELKKTT